MDLMSTKRLTSRLRSRAWTMMSVPPARTRALGATILQQVDRLIDGTRPCVLYVLQISPPLVVTLAPDTKRDKTCTRREDNNRPLV